MPYAAEFHDAARSFDDEAAEADGMPGPLTAAVGPGVLTGGALTADTNALVSGTSHDCRLDAGDLRDLAAECRRRAEICEAAAEADRLWRQASARHDLRMRDWRADRNRWLADPETYRYPGNPPGAPTRPRPPFDWVEF